MTGHRAGIRTTSRTQASRRATRRFRLPPVPTAAPASGMAATGTGATAMVAPPAAGRRSPRPAAAGAAPVRAAAVRAAARSGSQGSGAGYGGPGYGGGSYGPGGRPTRRGWRRWVRPKRILLVLLALVLVLAVVVGFLYVNINNKLNRVNVLTAYSGRPGADGRHELADRRLRQPGRADPRAGGATRPRARRCRRLLRHDHDLAHPVQREHADACQHPA